MRLLHFFCSKACPARDRYCTGRWYVTVLAADCTWSHKPKVKSRLFNAVTDSCKVYVRLCVTRSQTATITPRKILHATLETMKYLTSSRCLTSERVQVLSVVYFKGLSCRIDQSILWVSKAFIGLPSELKIICHHNNVQIQSKHPMNETKADSSESGHEISNRPSEEGSG